MSSFGVMPDGSAVEVHTLRSASGMEVSFLSLGGIITSVKVPDRNGTFADVTPGYETVGEYLADRHYFGALIGRFANRIAGGRFALDGVAYQLPPNEGSNVLHGGKDGFHRVLWEVEAFERAGVTGAVLTHTSPSGTAGFPGELSVRVTYSLSDDNALTFDYEATSDEPTPVNLTQHMYINLAGHDAPSIEEHELSIAAPAYLPVDDELIPTGEIRSVAGTPFDIRYPQRIGSALEALAAEAPGGFDHTYVLGAEVAIAAVLRDPASGRTMQIETTEPGLQYYSGNQILTPVHGKAGATYRLHAALALETQHFPDSVNQPSFPDTILRPGFTLRSRTAYRFGTDG